MNKEEFDNDFEPRRKEFIIEENTEEDVTKTSDNISVQDANKKVDIPEFIDKKPKKKIPFKKIITSVLIVLMVIVIGYLISLTEYFRNYKTNFYINIQVLDSKLGISETLNELFHKDAEDDFLQKREEGQASGTTYDNESYLVPFENANDGCFKVVSEGVLVAKSNYFALMDKKGKELWNLNTSVVNPILEVDGRYTMLAENGGTKVCLYEGNKLIYAVDAQNEILNANVSSKGDVVVVTKKEFFKGAVEVFNKGGERIFSWNSGSESVMCADISPAGRKIAVGFLNSKDTLKGTIQIFNIDQGESYKTIEIPDTVIFKLQFTGEILNVFCDNAIVGLSVHGAVLWNRGIDGEFAAYSIDNNGNKVICIDKYNVPEIKVYSKRGRQKKTFNVDELPDYVDIRENKILYNNTRMIYFGKHGKLQKYAASMDVRGLKIIDENTYLIIYSNSLEFVRV